MMFQNKKWSILQVNHVVEAEINITSLCLEKEITRKDKYITQSTHSSQSSQRNMICFAGTHAEGQDQHQFRLGLRSDQAICSFPILLHGARCYSDASAGLGIFILDPSEQLKVYIKASVNQVTSVLMAEAAGLAFAAWVTSLLHIRDISFLTDCQILVNFFNSSDLSSPPSWDIKQFTQRFLNAVANSNRQVLKVERSLNTTAHSLATQAFKLSDIQCNQAKFSCSNVTHVSGCPLSAALQFINWDPYSLIAAACC